MVFLEADRSVPVSYVLESHFVRQPNTPARQLGHSLRLEELEDTLVAVLPLHQTLVLVLLWVDQDVPNELPQMCQHKLDLSIGGFC
ncbi:hypothetical protein J4Q44_G00080750 [Coregonus suidteri]|uniref:Uncharacterized protein n=1 Tax=Coregonus suidteri TaxID=861788 RepID=A0AAN8M3C7_9TELE